MADVFIDGFGIAGFRSFGEDMQFIGPCRQINLLIGQNNSGKSNILSFLARLYGPANKALKGVHKGKLLLYELDHHIDAGARKPPIRFAFGLEPGGPNYEHVLNEASARADAGWVDEVRRRVDRILRSQTLTLGCLVTWLEASTNTAEGTLLPGPPSETVPKLIAELGWSPGDWRELVNQLTKNPGIDQETNVSTILGIIAARLPNAPEVTIIPAIRQVAHVKANQEADHSGIGLIDKLARLQNPSRAELHNRQHFEEINKFLVRVIGNQSARLEIPYDRDVINVHMDGRTLPLEALGTGVSEVVILAAAATVLRGQVLCIEEPELHLHPILQKKLMRYLRDKTDNQYFISTHSAHLLDTLGAAIFHIRHQDGVSTVDPVFTASDKSLVCVDLGYRPSDLLQANCVIWVEGPSDRIYLNHWLHSAAPGFIEGIHYSIMFYGGRLLSHLTADDPEVTEFISLRRLNRHISIVIDSDRQSAHAALNQTKKRVKAEFDAGPGFAWITKGREIENYIDQATLEAAVKAVHPKAIKLAASGQFDHALFYRTSGGIETVNIDKVKIAHAVAALPANLEILDLKLMIEKLIEFIRDANDFQEESL